MLSTGLNPLCIANLPYFNVHAGLHDNSVSLHDQCCMLYDSSGSFDYASEAFWSFWSLKDLMNSTFMFVIPVEGPALLAFFVSQSGDLFFSARSRRVGVTRKTKEKLRRQRSTTYIKERGV